MCECEFAPNPGCGPVPTQSTAARHPSSQFCLFLRWAKPTGERRIGCAGVLDPEAKAELSEPAIGSRVTAAESDTAGAR